ncbi:16S rRNA (cytosine(967)-C(5))-methyltransferase RsmB [Caldimonas caldifontis]|uniref:16S rRNA (cytosine(967)-C(5))-methyltransferase n=1 Tax=Caldimonas caldifontis TaxID=1452508 RepID=A0A2S5SUI7_9BURK|nr:16S rRNA (cytosine(967)-C(5))-methyltransferase RsmB [Caldimonas caldifontis]PPE66354.1 16S rRNA (cytosine(967)-C(5))-methyltransferase RsmB [Caldimonas caldifontis]
MNAPSLPLSRLLVHTAEAVRAVERGRSLTEVLARVPASARGGTQALSFAVMRELGRARALRRHLVPRAPAPPLEALLCTALALLVRGPASGYDEHTLVDQAVEAAKRQARGASGLVNAVLRRFLRERTACLAAVEAEPEARWNHPAWWVDRLRADWPAQWEAVLASSQQHPPMTLRVNRRRTQRDAYARRLAEAGVGSRPVGEVGLLLDSPRPVEQIPGFAEGLCSVQDLAAQWAAPLLLGTGLPPGARVLDACAAPGGKTAHLLEAADLDLLALDSDAQRLQRVDQTLSRLGLHAQLKVADARETTAWWDGRPFDAILLDAPCSASGIVRRHPDIRWLRRPGDIAALARLQRELLDALWPLLKPGGHVLYCTCSVFRAEGSAQIDAFLQRQPLARACPSPGHALPVTDNGSSPVADHDGFYYALIQRSPD